MVIDPSAAVLSAGAAAVLVGAGLLVVDTKRPPHRDPSPVPEWLGTMATLLGALGTGTLDSLAGVGAVPFFATTLAGLAVAAVAMDRRNGARHAAIFGRVTDALDDAVVSGDRMTGRFRGRAVEVLLSAGGVNRYASMAVVLADSAGQTDWCIEWGRLPRRWRSKGWRVKSRDDPALADQLMRLGAPTLLPRRYRAASGRWEAELMPPSVCYSAARHTLCYEVAVGSATMDTLSREHLTALLFLLWSLVRLNEHLHGMPAPRRNGCRPPAPEQSASGD